MDLQRATYEQLVALKQGSPIVVNTKDSICDIAIFMEHNREKGTVLALDCFLRKSSGDYVQNLTEYSECFIVPQDKERLLKLLQRKM